jgi:opacity protein-like surface antigen
MRIPLLAALFTFLMAPMSWGQLPFGFGLKGGAVRVEGASPAITGGPYLEVKIPFLISVESGVLFKRFDYAGRSQTAYEIPVLLKKRIGPFPVQPFLAAGATIRNAQRTDTGFTVGAGVTFNALLIKVEPEVRYTRYPGGTLPRSQNQTEILVGLRF